MITNSDLLYDVLRCLLNTLTLPLDRWETSLGMTGFLCYMLDYHARAEGGGAMDMADFERRLTRIEDIEAIKQLKARYCDVCDDNHNPSKITTLFVEDGIWEGGDFGTAQGHEAIRQLFQTFQKLISFSQHMVMNPIIAIEGNRAKGTWYFLGPFTFRKDTEAKWVAVRYEDDYVKVNGEWKYQHLRAHVRMSAAYDKGWAKKDEL